MSISFAYSVIVRTWLLFTKKERPVNREHSTCYYYMYHTVKNRECSYYISLMQVIYVHSIVTSQISQHNNKGDLYK